MDLFFAVATTEDIAYVSDEALNVRFGGGNEIHIPIIHDRVQSVKELNELRKVLHKRIDSIIDSSLDFYTEKKKNKKKETIRVFNCFGDEPEIVEIEI